MIMSPNYFLAFVIIILKITNSEEDEQNRFKKQIDDLNVPNPLLNENLKCERKIAIDHEFQDYFNELNGYLFKIVLQNSRGKNTIMYPLQIFRTLTMVMAGAMNKTLHQFEHELSLENMDGVEYQVLVKMYRRHLDCFKIQGYDSIFNMTEHAFFGALSLPQVALYGAKVLLDFGLNIKKYGPYKLKTDLLKALNDAVKDNTDKKMDGYFNEIIKNELTMGTLFSTHVFKQKWKYPFKEQNESGYFHITENKKVPVKLIKFQQRLKYSAYNFNKRRYDWVNIPFEKSRLSLILIVPHKGRNLGNVEEDMGRDLLGRIIRYNPAPIYNNVTVYLPTFELGNARVDIKDFFKDKYVGLDKVMSSSVELFCMSPLLQVHNVFQNHYLKLDEQGVESIGVVDWLLDTRTGPPATELPGFDFNNITIPKPGDNIDNIGSYKFPLDVEKCLPSSIYNITDIPSFLDSPSKNTAQESFDGNEEVEKPKSTKRQRGIKIIINAIRPFVYALVDNYAKIPLVYGSIYDPTKWSN